MKSGPDAAGYLRFGIWPMAFGPDSALGIRLRGSVEAASAGALQHSELDAEHVTRASHEAAHQLSFNTGLLKRGVMYPFWVSEGLATNFEAGPDGAFGFRNANEPRLRQLRAAAHAKRLIRIEEFVAVARISGDSTPAISEADGYAEAWGVFRFLLSTRPGDLSRYLRSVSALEPGRRDAPTLRREFDAAFGSAERVAGEWAVFLDKVSR
jgi:hypothetical protein